MKMDTPVNSLLLNQLASSIASLSTGKYSDFSIRCNDGSVILAHRAVVCPRSRVLAAAIDGKFQEAISNKICLEEDEPGIVGKMLDFLYKSNYDDHRNVAPSVPIVDSNFEAGPSSATTFNFQNNTEDTVEVATEAPLPDSQYQISDKDQPKNADPYSLLINAKVYIIADKYEIQALKDLAVSKYKNVLPKTWNSSAFAESALLVCENTMDTDRMLRDIIIQGASKNIRTLLDRDDFVDLLKRQSDLAVEVLRQVVAGGSRESPIEEENNPWRFRPAPKKNKGGSGIW